jgi:hypothetical protein
MKAFIVGLFSLTVLAGCATTELATFNVPPVPTSAVNGVCNANDGIFIILINNKGEKQEFLCPKIKGKTIVQEGKVRAGLVKKLDTDLGHVDKYGPSDPANPDPCVNYVAGGQRRFFCW